MNFVTSFSCCVIAHPDNDAEARKTQKHLEEDCEFPADTIKVIRGLRPPPRGGMDNLVQSISLVHARCLSIMNREGCVDRKQHVMIVEDDCRFTSGDRMDVHHRLTKLIESVEKLSRGKWHSLHVGHVPLGPTIPVGASSENDVIVWSSLPFAGHAYLINYRFLRTLANTWGRRPYNYEGMMGSPIMTRFAVQPPMATQIRRPKELCQIDETVHFTSWMDFKLTNDIVCVISLVIPVVLAYGVLKILRLWFLRFEHAPVPF